MSKAKESIENIKNELKRLEPYDEMKINELVWLEGLVKSTIGNIVEKCRRENSIKTPLYKHTLRRIDRIINNIDRWFEGLSDSDYVYVYMKSFKNDDILTGRYYHACGEISDEQEKEKYENAELLDMGDMTWDIKCITLSELKAILIEEKNEQQKLEKKYPGIITG